MARRGSCLRGLDAAYLGTNLSQLAATVANIASSPIRGFDWLLRRIFEVQPCTDDPRCILRISLGYSRRDLLLSDGTRILRGEALIGLDAWNERLHHQGPNADPLAWGSFLLHRFRYSLGLLASDGGGINAKPPPLLGGFAPYCRARLST